MVDEIDRLHTDITRRYNLICLMLKFKLIKEPNWFDIEYALKKSLMPKWK
jgi:hypothetical protein